MRIVALVPAHNEEATVAQTVASLQDQSRPPDHIVVIADNCTDDTVRRAEQAGAEVLHTVDNTHRKAGALNQALERYQGYDLVLAMDADTVLSPHFIERALVELEDPEVGGVGAVFRAPEPSTVLELFQHLEWVRYAEQIERTGKTFVMSGTAALIRRQALQDVHDRFGRFYETASITEDSRLTLDLKLTGWKVRSPVECSVVTETQTTWRELFVQRRRWYLGALQNLTQTGWNRALLPYWGQQAALAVSVTLMALLIGMTVTAVVLGVLGLHPGWLSLSLIFAAERVATVWDEPIRRRVFAAVIVPELIYALFLQAAYLAALGQWVTKREGIWRRSECTEAIQVKRLGWQPQVSVAGD